MKRSRMVSLNARLMILAGVAVVIVGACRRDRSPDSDTAVSTPGATPTPAATPTPTRVAACSISSDSIRRLTRGAFVAWASRLAYEPQNRQLGYANGFDAAAEVRVEVPRGVKGDSVSQADIGDGCVIARIYSRRPDPRVGLGRGWTYIWADSLSPPSASFVPEEPTAPVVGQNLNFAETPPATVASPRHICSGCGRDWCVYPTDTIGTGPVEFLKGP